MEWLFPSSPFCQWAMEGLWPMRTKREQKLALMSQNKLLSQVICQAQTVWKQRDWEDNSPSSQSCSNSSPMHSFTCAVPQPCGWGQELEGSSSPQITSEQESQPMRAWFKMTLITQTLPLLFLKGGKGPGSHKVIIIAEEYFSCWSIVIAIEQCTHHPWGLSQPSAPHPEGCMCTGCWLHQPLALESWCIPGVISHMSHDFRPLP